MIDNIFADSVYRIEEELGAGGGGVVYKAWHKRLQKYVVIKEIIGSSKANVDIQRNEVEALKNVKSEYLPQVFDFIESHGRVFTVMEFINGESFDKLLNSGKTFSQNQVLKWYKQIAAALIIIHRQNIVHRDIKPANIMLLPNGNVCLIDFNAALVEQSNANLISRSLGYASPEQYQIYELLKNGSVPSGDLFKSVSNSDKTEIINDKTEIIDKHKAKVKKPQKTDVVSSSSFLNINWKLSDIYSLGAAMYSLLTGIRPDEHAENVIPLSKMGGFSESISYIIDCSMKVSPSDRFQSAEELSKALDNIHKFDASWKIYHLKNLAAVIILPLAFSFFAGMTFIGYNQISQSKEEEYYSYIYDIRNTDDPYQAFEKALSCHDNSIEPYYVMTERLWNDGNIEECKDFIEKNLGYITELKYSQENTKDVGSIYYILGNCCYYLSDEGGYENSIDCYKSAIELVKDDPLFYRDYAIALAKTGDTQQAEKEMEKAQLLNLDKDSIELINGEISMTNRDYDKAQQYFEDVISNTNDDAVRYRAYISLDDVFKIINKPELSAKLLNDAQNDVPLNYRAIIKSRLADAYIRAGNNEGAIGIYQQLSDDGVISFDAMQNWVILLENSKDYDSAAQLLEKMAQDFPQDYRVPMRQALLEADRQSSLSIEQKDYQLTKQYFDEALKLYNTDALHNSQDEEMEQLKQLIETLKANNWID